MSVLFKKILTLFVLGAFSMLLVFGVFTMLHNSDGQMLIGCPFSIIDVSDCAQDTLASAIHHISSYQSFLTVIVDYGLMMLLISFLILVSVFFTDPNIFKPFVFIKDHNHLPVFCSTRKMIRWLALLENSPSFS